MPVAVLLIVLAGAALRLFALRFQGMVTADGTEYIHFAEALRAGHSFVSVFPPGYPILIALAHLLVPDWVVAAVAIQMLAGVALPLLVWSLARPALGDRGALLPAVLCAAHLELARHSAITMSESVYTALLYAAFLALAARPTRRASLAGGLALGAACAIRPEGLVAALVLAVAGGIAIARGRRPAGAVLLAAGSCALVLLACVLWYHETLGVWTLTPKTSALHAAAADWHALEPRIGETAARAAPLASRFRRNLLDWPANARLHAEALLWSWPLPLLILSLWGLARRRGLEGAALVYLPLLGLLGLSQQGRFTLPAIPALAIAASVPVFRESARWRRGVAIALLLLGQTACLWSLSDAFRTPFEGGQFTDRFAGKWLGTISIPGETVVDRKPFVAFYANRPHRILPAGTYDALLNDLVQSGARWLVLQDNVTRHMRPELAPLLDSASVRERETRVEMVYGRADAGDGSLAIFRILRHGEKKTGAAPVVQLGGFGGQPEPR